MRATKPHRPTWRTHGRAGLGAGALAGGAAVANLLGYAFFAVLNRHLSREDLGSAVALLNLALVAGVPALATQLVVARAVAKADPRDAAGRAATVRTAIRTGLVVGVGATVAAALAAPFVTRLLQLDSSAPALILATSLLPMCVLFSVQGILQGEHRFGLLAVVLVGTALARVGAALASARVDSGLQGTLTIVALSSWVAGLGSLAVLLAPGLRLGTLAGAAARPAWLRDVLAGSAATAAMLTASNIDVPLARYVLPAHAAGTYAVGALFSKAAFWGPAFLVTFFYPRIARARSHRASALTVGLTVGVCAVGILAAIVLARPLVAILAGADYGDVVPRTGLFTAIGAAWAVAQVLVYADLARGHHLAASVVWVGLIGLVVAVVAVRPQTVDALALILLSSALVVVVGCAAVTFRRPSAATETVVPELL